MTPETPRSKSVSTVVYAEGQKRQFHAMIDAAHVADADLVQVIGRGSCDRLMFVAVFARGEFAERLLEFLEKDEKDEDAS